MMRKVFLILSFITLAAVLTAASCLPDQRFVKGVEGYNDAILPEYKKYVIDREPVPDWSESEKEIRMDSVKGLKDLVEEAKKKGD